MTDLVQLIRLDNTAMKRNSAPVKTRFFPKRT